MHSTPFFTVAAENSVRTCKNTISASIKYFILLFRYSIRGRCGLLLKSEEWRGSETRLRPRVPIPKALRCRPFFGLDFKQEPALLHLSSWSPLGSWRWCTSNQQLPRIFFILSLFLLHHAVCSFSLYFLSLLLKIWLFSDSLAYNFFW